MSDIYSITRGQLEDVADAIRLKTGKSAKMTVAEMPNEINSIEPGGGGGLVCTSNCIAKSNGIVLPGIIGIVRIPTPDDCPFICNLTYFMDSPKEWTIASATYKKNDANYAVGVCLQIAPGGEQWTAPVLMSTDIDAVKYSVDGTDCSQDFPPRSFQYDDGENTATWYYSVCYGQYGWHTPSGIVMLNNDVHPSTNGGYLDDNTVQSILQLMQVKNKPIQGGGN